MAADSPRNLRDELAALRIDRSAPVAKKPSRRPPPRWLAVGAGVLLALVALAVWLSLGGARPIEVAYASRVEAGRGPPPGGGRAGAGRGGRPREGDSVPAARPAAHRV